MIQADYQLALLLQREFVTESERKSSDTFDYDMALMLQNHFEHETNNDSPKNNLVYDKKSSQDRPKDDTRSLVDPSWELIDPNPNIHTLFVAFSGRFFWNMLQTVSVSWSKRMTSCAGVCTYNPGGMCIITLSEPLLKLRPRKDLVETLLHEMIHAYLFVTHNNRDRDGHGPEFHKHMYRINKDAGTNITVYHSFHDEVRLYQQHWWRCNGPCQYRKPFFGIVRRATNRAPGTNDRWWNEHARTCGGAFIKIREPEKTKSKLQTEKKRTDATKNPNKDIRNFVEVLNGKNRQIENDKNVNNKSNVKSFENSKDNNSKVINLSSNIVGFANLNKSLNRMNSNSNSTIVVTKKPTTSTNLHTNNFPSNSSNKNFQGTGQLLQLNAAVKSNDYSVVKDRWLNKFDLNTQTGNKRTQNDVALDGGDTSLKKTKLTSPNDGPFVLEESVECPVCVKKIPAPNLNNHLDKCLELHSETICIICGKEIPRSQLSHHQSNCFDNFAEDSQMQKCEICNIFIEQSHEEEHVKACLGKIFNSEMDSTAPHASFIECQVCYEMIDSSIIEKHTDLCLHKRMFNEIENRVGLESSNILVHCLGCNKKVRRSELNTHLDECMKDVFDDKNDFIETKQDNEDKKKSDCDSETDRRYNCPFCLESYSEFDMCAHIDECLASGKSKTDDKSLLIDSFINDDF